MDSFRRLESRDAGSRGAGASVALGELWLTAAMLALTLGALLLAGREVVTVLVRDGRASEVGGAARQGIFLALTLALVYGSLVYQLSRLGYLLRQRRFRVPRDPTVEDWLRTKDAPAVTILVPAYKEEVRTIEQTLMSAALQDLPDRTVVLLLDDPPFPSDESDARRLREARAVAGRIQALLDAFRLPLEAERVAYRARARAGTATGADEACRLASLYRSTAGRIQELAAGQPRTDHTDALYVEKVLMGFAEQLSRRAEEVGQGGLDAATVRRIYDRLAGMFRADVRCFERKRYLNLSHEPNKAMNLNAYIGLIGRRFVEREAGRHALLWEASADRAGTTYQVPDARYVVTLDADSLLLPGYVARLVHMMERSGNERVAVIQTPYSAIPGAPGALERVAGATTDVQYLFHQGSSAFSAAYWVGANAVLRKDALDDIACDGTERGFRVRRYIQDRTAIEDTESSIDLVRRGWSVLNYPRRLAYSATPPDFGSVLIQRRRWANGGLIILPKLLRYLTRPFRFGKVLEGFVRVHYLVSLTGVNSALLIMLVVPFGQDLHDPWLALTALPYFFLYGRDLVSLGYRVGDVLRVYAFNLMLIPIQLAGVAKSVQQLVTGAKTPFARTPKVVGRTAAPRAFVAMEYALLLYLLYSTVMNVLAAAWLQAAFTLINGVSLVYAAAVFMGWRASLEDLRLHPATRWRRRLARRRPVPRRRRRVGGPGARFPVGFAVLGRGRLAAGRLAKGGRGNATRHRRP